MKGHHDISIIVGDHVDPGLRRDVRNPRFFASGDMMAEAGRKKD